jgi:O-antigen ligase
VTSPLPLVLTAEPGSYWRSFSSALDRVIFSGVFGLLLFGPLVFGAVEVWSISILEVGAGLLFLLWATRQVAAGELEILGNPLFPPMLLLAGLVLVQLATGRTAYRAQTSSAALMYCTYGLLSFLVVQCLRRTSQVKVLAWMFSGYGFAVAMFALIQDIAPNGKLYWLRTLESGGWIYGPFVDHNHYAGLMEMLTPIPLVISFADGVRASRRALAALAAALMASTIFLSGSRGGMAAFTVQMVLLAGFLITRRKNWKAALAFGAFVVIVLGLLVWLGGGELVERITSIHSGTRTELTGGTRVTIDQDSLRIFVQKPVLGWGLGVFPDIYPQFSSLATNLQVGMAHNDYLQLLVEMGALGLVTALWFLLTLFRSALRKLKSWPSDTNSAVTLAAMLGVMGILVHSFMDFNLQIPGNAALFYVLCMLCAMEPRFGRHLRRERANASREGTILPPPHAFRLEFATRNSKSTGAIKSGRFSTTASTG